MAEPVGEAEFPEGAPDKEYVRLTGLFTGLVRLLDPMLPQGMEVVLHDLTRTPHAIIAIAGSLTGRAVGDTVSDIIVERFTEDPGGDWRRYDATLPDGRWIRSGTLFINDSTGAPIAALGVHSDVTVWEHLDGIVASMLGRSTPASSLTLTYARPDGPPLAPLLRAEDPAGEPRRATAQNFPTNIESFVDVMIARELDAVGIPVDLMKKAHKVEVVRALKDRGVFQLKTAVEHVASALQVTRFTIYNYLNELDESDQ